VRHLLRIDSRYDCGMSNVVPVQTTSLWDRFGMVLSATCVVHCVLTPVLLSSSVVLAHLLPGEERTHRVLAMLVAMGAIALVRGFRVHGRWSILAMMAMGLGFIFFGAWFGEDLPSHGWEIAVTLAGSGLMIVAHRKNHTFCRDCRRCVA